MNKVSRFLNKQVRFLSSTKTKNQCRQWSNVESFEAELNKIVGQAGGVERVFIRLSLELSDEPDSIYFGQRANFLQKFGRKIPFRRILEMSCICQVGVIASGFCAKICGFWGVQIGGGSPPGKFYYA
ncbi:MAG: hypothetical protein JXB29_12485 [Sedimentisphaerales bacterium]|nr:hypothetical protein [Sedimentisphaerales bacterium]